MNDELLRALVTVLVSVVTTVGGVGFLTARAQRNRISAEGRLDDADAEVRISDAAIRLLKPYKEEAVLARREATEAKVHAAQQDLKISNLEREVENLKLHLRAQQQYIITHYPNDTGFPEYVS